ncbi:hypothetical protein BH10PSE7_BH10PSE7_15830 [soil metagenome]
MATWTVIEIVSPIFRYAIAIASSFEGASSIVAELVSNNLANERITILGQYKSFAVEASRALRKDGAATPSPDDAASLASTRIVSLGRIDNQILPRSAMQDATSLRQALDRWLTPAHSKRLSQAVGEGAFLVWVELKAAEEEQTVARCLLRNSHMGVAVHDFLLPGGDAEGWKHRTIDVDQSSASPVHSQAETTGLHK